MNLPASEVFQPRSHLFTVRLWLEDLGDDHAEIRGQVHHVLTGEVCYFRTNAALWAFCAGFLQDSTAGSVQE